MIVELAIATNTSPASWWEEEDATLATALDVLRLQAEAIKAARRG